MNKSTHALVGIAMLTSVSPMLAEGAKPEGWALAGNDPASYVLELDDKVVHGGKTSARLASTRTPQGFGTLSQSCEPGEYRGKRLKLSAYVKTQDVKDWAGVWMRVDGPEKGRTLAFDNMQDRPMKGTMDWTRHEVVLDVPDEASTIVFGILMNGEGTLWVDDLEFLVVDKSVPTTGASLSPKPKNLNFER